MGFTLTGSTSQAPLDRDTTAPRPTHVTAQTKRAKEPFHKPLSDRIRTGVRFAPHSVMPKEHLGPSDRDRLRGIGPARATGAAGWFVHGPTRDEVMHREEIVLAIVGKEKFADKHIGKDEHGKPIWERRFWEDTRVIEVTREQAVRMNAWIPPAGFMSAWTPREN